MVVPVYVIMDMLVSTCITTVTVSMHLAHLIWSVTAKDSEREPDRVSKRVLGWETWERGIGSVQRCCVGHTRGRIRVHRHIHHVPLGDWIHRTL